MAKELKLSNLEKRSKKTGDPKGEKTSREKPQELKPKSQKSQEPHTTTKELKHYSQIYFKANNKLAGKS